MIIKGSVQTMTAPVPIEKISKGMTVITSRHTPAKVISVKKKETASGLLFKLNPSLIVAEGTRIYTAYGLKQAR